jgi:hypothetical protein
VCGERGRLTRLEAPSFRESDRAAFQDGGAVRDADGGRRPGTAAGGEEEGSEGCWAKRRETKSVQKT